MANSTIERIVKLPNWNNPATQPDRVKNTFGKYMPRGKSGLMLDVGCSEGFTTEEISIENPEASVIGIDKNSTAILEARQKKTMGSYLLVDVLKNTLPKEAFDYVFCMNNVAFSLDGQTEEIFREVLSRITRLVRPYGQLLVSMASQFGVYEKNDDGFTEIASEVRRVVDPNGDLLEENKSPLYLMTKLLTGVPPNFRRVRISQEDIDMNSHIVPIYLKYSRYPRNLGASD